MSGLRALIGPDTPGLDALAAAPRRLKLGYVELPDGARLEIRSDARAQAVTVRRMLNQVVTTFGTKASVGRSVPDSSTTTTPGPSAPSGFLG